MDHGGDGVEVVDGSSRRAGPWGTAATERCRRLGTRGRAGQRLVDDDRGALLDRAALLGAQAQVDGDGGRPEQQAGVQGVREVQAGGQRDRDALPGRAPRAASAAAPACARARSSA